MATLLDTLCKDARNLPEEVKERIWYFSPPPHPTASLLKTLEFEYGPVAYEPLSSVLYVRTFERWLARPHCNDQPFWKVLKQFWICRSKYHPKFTDLPDWVVEETSGSSSGNSP